MRFLLFLVAPLIIAAPATASAEAPTAGFHMEISNIPADPPGHMLMAPGGGRELTPAVIYTPAAGGNIYGPAIVMLDNGPGSNPGRQDEPTRFAAERLAARGYTVLSLYSHMERGYPINLFEQTRYDIGAALDLLERMGYEDLVLAGRGYGADAIANYLASADDASLATPNKRRVRAAVLFSPLTDVRAFVNSKLAGTGYPAQVELARGYVEAKTGLIPRDIEAGYVPAVEEAPWLVTGQYVLPAEAFLNYFGPTAQARNLAVLSKLPIPTLAVVPAGDPSSSAAVLTGLKAPALEVRIEAAADYSQPAVQDRFTDEMATWLAAHDLGVRPAVKTTFASIRSADGQIFTGVLYTPAAGIDPKKPAFILHHGLSEDAVHSSTHWVGWRLAQAGYAAMAVATHASGTVGATMTGNLAEVADDIGRWSDWMDSQGYKRLILLGHSNGGIVSSNYLSLTHDKRVVGVVYMAPTLDSPRYSRETLGDKVYEQQVAEAEAAVARGEGDTHLMTQDKLRLARHFLDANGPHSRAMHTERIKEFDQPILVIAGDHDPLMTRDPNFIKTFTHNHPGPSEVHWLVNGSHGMKESKDRVRDYIVDWTRRMFESR